MYELKEASRQWFAKLTTSLLDAGYTQSLADYSLFTLKNGGLFIAVVVYVDDILVTRDDLIQVSALKSMLDAKFSIKDLGEIKYYLGFEVVRNNTGIFINQRKCILDLLTSADMLDAKPLTIPLDQHTKLHDNAASGELLSNHSLYRSWVGKLLYLTLSHPDISYSVQIINQFMQNPRDKHLVAATRVLRYLKCTAGKGLLFPANNNLVLTGYCDSDWGSCPTSRRSISGYCLLLGPSLVSWQSKKQSVTSRSTAEAEYRALATTTCEVLWLHSLLKDLQVSISGPTTLFCDNKAAIDIAENPVYHARTKHIEIDCHFVR